MNGNLTSEEPVKQSRLLSFWVTSLIGGTRLIGCLWQAEGGQSADDTDWRTKTRTQAPL